MRAAPAFHLQAEAPMPDIPKPLTFTEMADVLLRAARQASFGLDALHLFALRDPTEISVTTIADVQRQCAALFEMSVLMLALAPYEDQVRGIAETSRSSCS